MTCTENVNYGGRIRAVGCRPSEIARAVPKRQFGWAPIGANAITIKQPLSDVLVDAIRVAGLHGGDLVRQPRFRGCWTYRDCRPRRVGRAGGLPKWWVTDNTVHSLIRRGIAVVTHTRVEGRPAVVRVSMTDHEDDRPVDLTVVVDGKRFGGFTAESAESVAGLFAALRHREHDDESLEIAPLDSGSSCELFLCAK